MKILLITYHSLTYLCAITPLLGAPEEAKAFADLAEAELDGMHEGNFARYRIRPSEFAAWRAVWR